ncbi:MAG: zinc-dependent metalloprotease [Saprospiraceae bacterium]|nr:zinc-dependent metalloprotease [Saprospiraceae bacterium]MCF8249267.1 zinc-dependent metalloprotease [Saprospiraceae bacterium]MCF8281165.1 zinc-dependent metalloprotease [Bacteroidales bacterium]MCF8311456.1 zinc-dependent metalloprotease [Saprospiraceae bacterium]MCF8439886.1 zinc-dependent metalloprotease [Saprospiraceae bacterium]
MVESPFIAEGASIALHENAKNTNIPFVGFNTYKGTIVGKPDSKAFFALSSSQMRGSFFCDNNKYEIRPLSKKGRNIQQNKYMLLASKGGNSRGSEKNLTPPDDCDGCSGGPCPGCYVSIPNRICRDVVNNNGVSCETIPLYQQDFVDGYPIVELAGDVDNEFFNLYSSGAPHPAYPSLDEGVVLEVMDILGYAQDTYWDYFGTNIWLVHLNIWATPDGYNNSSDNSLFTSLKNYWNSHKQCIHRDVVHLFSGASLGYDGVAQGDVCGGEKAAYSITSHHLGDSYRTAKALAHEFGHHLGGYHDDRQMCCQALNLTPNVIMFSDGIFDGNYDFVWSEISQYQIQKYIYASGRVSCLTGVSTSFETDCIECSPVIIITADNQFPQPNCGDKDIINFTIELCNYCDATVNWQLDLSFTSSLMTAEDMGDFNQIQFVGLSTKISGTIYTLIPNQCVTLHFQGKVVGFNSSQTLGIRPSVNGIERTEYSISLPLVNFPYPIGGQGEQSLTYLLSQFPNIQPNMAPIETTCGDELCSYNACKDKNVLQRLEIDVPEFCFNHFNFKMEPGSEIVVKAGNTLTISNSRLFACSNMWRGITVENGATLIMDNCTIEDAQYAIRAPYGSANIAVTNSKFNRNFVGIYIDGPSVAGLSSLGPFYGNTFEGEGSLLPPYSGQGASPAISIGNKSFAGVWVQTKANAINAFENNFFNLSNGIYVNQTNLALKRCQFKNILENGYADWTAGYGVRGLDYNNSYAYHFTCEGFGKNSETFSFYNCSKGIRIEGMNVGRINRNAIDAVTGIELINCYPKAAVFSNKVITYNTGIAYSHMQPGTDGFIDFNDVEVDESGAEGIKINLMGVAPKNGISVKHNNIELHALKTTGILSTGGNKLLVSENDVIGDAALNTFNGIRINNDMKSYFLCNNVQTSTVGGLSNTIGISVFDGEETNYNCNTVINVGKGVFFQMGSFAPEKFTETSFTDNGVGLYVSAASAIGPQSHRGNKWTGAFGGFGAQHESNNPIDWDASRFTTHTATGVYYPSLSFGQNQWFSIGSGSPSNVCPVCLPPSPPSPPDSESELFNQLDGAIASGSFGTSAYSSETTKLANRYLYRKLTEYPLLIQSAAVYQSFYSAQSNSNVGQFHSVESAIKGLYAIPANTENSILANFDSIALYLDAIADIDSIASNNEGMTLSMAQQRESAVLAVKGFSDGNATTIQPVIAQRQTDAASAYSQNSAISVQSGDKPNWNNREVNNIFLNTVAVGNNSFDGTQYSTLSLIAGQCPLTGGSAVFKARSLLSVVEDISYDDDEICQPVGQRQANQAENFSNVSIFPNPAKNEITVILPQNMDGKLNTVIIYDALGMSVLEKIIPKKSRSILINTSELKDGLYLVKVQVAGKQVFADKLIIIQ